MAPLDPTQPGGDEFFCLEISVYTEITDHIDSKPARGWVLYDASCSFCSHLAERFRGTLQASGFQLEPLQSPWARDFFHLPYETLLAEMHVVTRDGEFSAAQTPWLNWQGKLTRAAGRGGCGR